MLSARNVVQLAEISIESDHDSADAREQECDMDVGGDVKAVNQEVLLPVTSSQELNLPKTEVEDFG